MTERTKPLLPSQATDVASGKEASASAAGAASSRPESAFDIWLNRGLHQLFDDVANEPVPDALLKLIQEDQNK